MKHFLILLFTLLCGNAFGQYSPDEDKELEIRIRNGVKSCTTYDYSFAYRDFIKLNYIEYNRKGDEIKNFDYLEDSSIVYRLICDTTKKGLLKKCVAKKISGEKSHEEFYDSLGRITKDIGYEKGKIKNKIRYTYYYKDKLFKTETFNTNDSLIRATYYKYSDGMLLYWRVVESLVDSMGIRNFYTAYSYTYTYDENKRTKESSMLSSNGRLMDKNVYSYNSDGNVIEVNYFDSVGVFLSKEVFKYSDANVVEWIEYNDTGAIIEHSEMKYDDKGLMIEQIDMDREKGPKTITKFVYDFYK